MDYAAARFNMVEGQIKPNKVTNFALLNAMANIPRELFVPASARGIAYVDEDIRIADGRYLVEPMVLARLIDHAAIEPGDIVLDIGCGTGYSSAVLGKLASAVVAVESDPDLAARATELLPQIGVDNAVVVEGALREGYPGQAPYQAILINGSVAEVPESLTDQLADGGRLVVVVADRDGVGRATLYQRTGRALSRRALFDASTPYLPGFEPKPAFQF
jgi:protein-L-isoaspartate(D-aspartate) O-methyltransferase